MKTSQWCPMMILWSLVMLGGCVEIMSPVPQERQGRSVTVLPQHIEDLAGSWAYKDTAGEGIITLNAEGKGAYEWEEGLFETLSLRNGVWTGVWRQDGNDREGGFELIFSDDASVAQGKWWYTRIGKDKDPLQPGGPFRMIRSSTVQISP